MLHTELWFAWFPVRVTTRKGGRTAWLETVMREQTRTPKHQTAWRYYTQK
jgi:hypothetical protein